MPPPPSLPVHPPNGPHHNNDSRPPPPKSQKEMTKAERRELQERQRAAKAAAKTSGQPSSSAPMAKKTNKPAENAPRAPPPTPGRPKDMARTAGAAHDAAHGNERGLRIFSHFGLPKAVSAPKGDIHPAILRLALQFSEFKIVGANARCIATLTAFKTVCTTASFCSTINRFRAQVIQDYVTPSNTTLSRHLMTHLSPQISHLVAARPMSVTMGNAIRQLKLEISGSDIDLPEQDVRTFPLPSCAPLMYNTCVNNIFCLSHHI